MRFAYLLASLGLSFFLSLSALAALTFRELPAGQIWIDASSCGELKQAVIDLAKWSRKKPLAIDCTKSTAPKSLEVSALFPEAYKNFKTVCSDRDGPNCFNAALALSQLLPNFRSSGAAEFKYFMSSPLCELLPATKALQTGDVLAQRDRGSEGSAVGSEYHAFIYLSADMSVEKKSREKKDGLGLRKTEEIYKEFEVLDPRCRHVGPRPPDFCRHYTQAFRCQTLDEYLLTRSPSVREKYRCISDEFSVGEKAVFSSETPGSVCPSPEKLLTEICAMGEFAGNPSCGDPFLDESMRHRKNGTLEQILINRGAERIQGH